VLGLYLLSLLNVKVLGVVNVEAEYPWASLSLEKACRRLLAAKNGAVDAAVRVRAACRRANMVEIKI
jgi:hypothetical protein